MVQSPRDSTILGCKQRCQIDSPETLFLLQALSWSWLLILKSSWSGDDLNILTRRDARLQVNRGDRCLNTVFNVFAAAIISVDLGLLTVSFLMEIPWSFCVLTVCVCIYIWFFIHKQRKQKPQIPTAAHKNGKTKDKERGGGISLIYVYNSIPWVHNQK